MEHQNQLEANLRRLKLPGMLFNLPMRIREAQESNLDYGEFFSLLVQDELCQRDNNMMKKRLRDAHFGQENTFEGFDFNFNESAIPSRLIREIASCRFMDMRQNIVIGGPPGIGKTCIAKSVGHEACRRGNTVIFKKAAVLLEDLKSEKLMFRNTLFKKCIKTDLLIIDDFGFKKLDNEETECLYRIVDERLGNRSIILTSNRPPEDWLAIFPDPVVGGAMLDRLVSGSIKILVNSKDGKSFRKEGKTI
jgi:DNA replication protein DnaC